MIFLVRSARPNPSTGKLESPARWRWVGSYDTLHPVPAFPVPDGAVLRHTSLVSWMVEWEERRRIAKAKLARGEDACV